MAKNSNKENKLLVACIHRDNSIWKEYIQQSFDDTVNATGAWDQKLQPANSIKHSWNKNLQNWNLVSVYYMVKKFKNPHFSSDKWQLVEKDFDNFKRI